MSVEVFENEHAYMSSMYMLRNPVETEHGIPVPTSEHAYNADRFVDEIPHKMVATAVTGYKAKTLTYKLLRSGAVQKPDWDFIKVGVMYDKVTQKFTRNQAIAELLIATGDQELVEGNNRSDHYWGVCPVGSRDGQNHLGRILMRVRFDLQHLDDIDITSAVDLAEI